jgi:hypothetical protein
MALGVFIGVILLLLLIGLVVLQGMIEWGGFDPDVFFDKLKAGKKDAKKPAAKPAKKTAKPAKKGKGKK